MLVPMVKPVLAISVLIKSSRLELLYYAVYSRHQRPEGSHHLRKHEQANRNIYSLYKPGATVLQTTYIWLWAIVDKLHTVSLLFSFFLLMLKILQKAPNETFIRHHMHIQKTPRTASYCFDAMHCKDGASSILQVLSKRVNELCTRGL